MIRKLAWIILLSLTMTGCIRVAGTAGWAKQGTQDEAPKVKSVGFDTNNLTGQKNNPGSIEI